MFSSSCFSETCESLRIILYLPPGKPSVWVWALILSITAKQCCKMSETDQKKDPNAKVFIIHVERCEACFVSLKPIEGCVLPTCRLGPPRHTCTVKLVSWIFFFTNYLMSHFPCVYSHTDLRYEVSQGPQHQPA